MDPLCSEPNGESFNGDAPRKRRKLEEEEGSVQESEWTSFTNAVDVFDIQHARGQGKFAFGFVEGPLVHALRYGDWYAFYF